MKSPNSRATEEPGRLRAVFARLAADGVAPAKIAEQAVLTWAAFDAALAPVIGQRGVDALYRRTLSLVLPNHGWLASVHEAGFRPGQDPAFRAAVAHQDRASAAAASGALLQTFHGLLVDMIGSALTDKLLQPAWDGLANGISGGPR